MTTTNSHNLLPYQSAFAANNCRFKIGLWARQTGKDHTCAFEAVADSLRNPGALWIIVAAGERQALESLAKAKEWAETLQLKIDDYSEEKSGPAARIQSAEIRWANGSRLLALPANPQTIRGYSANVILTEFAFHEKPDEIWRAIYPSISNPLRGGPKKLRIISTPNGLNNKFAQLWQNASSYHKSLITIHDAIHQGLPLNADELREGLADPDAWNQEYICQFADLSSVLLPYDLIESAESHDATDSLADSSLLPVGAWSQRDAHRTALAGLNGQLFAGIDFGRKHHLTVCWLLQRLNNKLITREVLTLKNMSTPEQLEFLRPRLRRCAKAALDYTGAGVGLGDYLAHEFGQCGNASVLPRASSSMVARAASTGKIELCQFTAALKGELFPRLRAAFEKRELLIPSSRDIREDLHAIHRFVSQNGQITYRAASTPDGHSDRCTALALALRAAQSSPASFPSTRTIPVAPTLPVGIAARAQRRALPRFR